MFVLIIRGRNKAYGPFTTEKEADDWLIEKSPDDMNEQPLVMELEAIKGFLTGLLDRPKKDTMENPACDCHKFGMEYLCCLNAEYDAQHSHPEDTEEGTL